MSRLPPFHLPVEVNAQNVRVRIRPITPADRERVLRGLRQISKETSYHRFFTPRFVPSEAQLRYLTEVDGDRHVALAAVNADDPSEPGLGAARYVRLKEEPDVAEAAILVIDEYQRHGVGALLMAALSRHAYENGVRAFRAYVMQENDAFLDYLRSLGATREIVNMGVVEIDLPVYANAEDFPETPVHDRVRWAWRALNEALVEKEV
ncbi:GNAT family N-acetyltransferase [Longibacter salinarum]|nr:GNAT family N-acetyltransferase [Longibacter salinarum]